MSRLLTCGVLIFIFVPASVEAKTRLETLAAKQCAEINYHDDLVTIIESQFRAVDEVRATIKEIRDELEQILKNTDQTLERYQLLEEQAQTVYELRNALRLAIQTLSSEIEQIEALEQSLLEQTAQIPQEAGASDAFETALQDICVQTFQDIQLELSEVNRTSGNALKPIPELKQHYDELKQLLKAYVPPDQRIENFRSPFPRY